MTTEEDERLLPFAPYATRVKPEGWKNEQLLTKTTTLGAAGDIFAAKASFDAELRQIVIGGSAAGYVYIQIQDEDHFRVTIYLLANTTASDKIEEGFRIRRGDYITIYAGQAGTYAVSLFGTKQNR